MSDDLAQQLTELIDTIEHTEPHMPASSLPAFRLRLLADAARHCLNDIPETLFNENNT